MNDYSIEDIEIKSVQNNIEQVLKTSEIKCSKETLKRIFESIDLTTLSGIDNQEIVEKLCNTALEFQNKGLKVAAICVYPPFAKLVSKYLKNHNINIACVAGAFPSGQSPLRLRKKEVEYAVERGATEIDMVISRGKFIAGEYDFTEKEVKVHKKACGKAHLKVILETGELPSLGHIKQASQIAIDSGADFIKTSTGKIQPAATLEAFYVMLQVIKAHYQKTGKKIGIKPAGGISDSQTALDYYKLLIGVLGSEWDTPKLFRIGASSLAGNVFDKINQE